MKSDARNMTPKEAQKYLIQIQEKTRQRQRNYVERKKGDGHRRVNTFLTSAAADVLEAELSKGGGRTIGDIISDALTSYAMRQHDNMTPPRVTQTRPSKTQVGNPDYDQEKTESFIMDLHRQGFSLSAIAGRLNDEGWPTQKTGARWHHPSVGRIIKDNRT